jgi:hypothetical protein
VYCLVKEQIGYRLKPYPESLEGNLMKISERNHNIEVLFFIPIVILMTCLLVYSLEISLVLILILPTLYLITKNPAIGLLIILALVSSIVFKAALPAIPLGIGYLYIPDAILMHLVLLTILSRAKSGRLLSDYEVSEKFLFFFLFVSTISLFNALFFHGVALNDAFGEFRILTYYLLYPVVIELVRNEKQIRFMFGGIFFLGLVVGVAMLIQALIGESVHIMPGRIETIGGGYYLDRATRILPPGQTLVYSIFIISGAILCLADRYNKFFVHISFIVCSVGVLLTFNRSYWVAGFFCFLVLFALPKKNAKARFLSRMFMPSIIVFFFTVMFCLMLPTGLFSSYFKSIEERVSSLFVIDELYDSGSFQWRKRENIDAVESIKNHPILGIGLANKYRKIENPSFELLETYIHNGYLWVLIRMGFFGCLPFVGFFLSFLHRSAVSFLGHSQQGSYLKSLHEGISLFILGVMVINFVNPMFMQWMSIVVIVITMGIADAVKRLE